MKTYKNFYNLQALLYIEIKYNCIMYLIIRIIMYIVWYNYIDVLDILYAMIFILNAFQRPHNIILKCIPI